MAAEKDSHDAQGTELEQPRWNATHLSHRCEKCGAQYRYPRAQVEGRVQEKKCMLCSTMMRVDGTASG